MQNMAGREFNSDSFAMWATDIKGPWSKPVYLTSIGFDPALLHADDGKHYLSILEWETRTGYQAPGHIVIAESDIENGGIVGDWHRVATGFTTRGCAEAPQLYQHDGYFYLMLAAGGTGYAHGVEMGRSKNVFGSYKPNHLFSLGDPDEGHFKMFNPNTSIQKAGHGSLVQAVSGEWYVAHLMSRPLPKTTLNPLGRETSLQQMTWTADDWLQMADGTNLAKPAVEAPKASAETEPDLEINDIHEDFSHITYDTRFMTPYREQDQTWVSTTTHPGHLTMTGGNSFFSKVNPAIMATQATSFNYTVTTQLAFTPIHYSQTAGLGLYYDSNNWLYLHLTQKSDESGTVLKLLKAKLGDRLNDRFTEVPVPDNATELQLTYEAGTAALAYRLAGQSTWHSFGTALDVSYLSDEGVNGEPGEIGGFTGLFNFIGSVDVYKHQSHADFDYYTVINHAKGEH